MSQPAPIDAVMRTLADPTRRAVFERVAGASEITVGELTRGSWVTQGAISQHLKSLKQAGLVVERPEGRRVYYRAEPGGSSRWSTGWATTACSGASASTVSELSSRKWTHEQRRRPQARYPWLRRRTAAQRDGLTGMGNGWK